MKVYAAIAAVMSRLSKTGIGKDQKNQQQGFKFRGIDDVYNALAPLLAECGLVVLPRVLDIERTDRASKSGGVLFHVVLKVEFDFVCAEDGSKHTVGPIFGEAMDSGDKAISKAMSIAYKYAAFQAFCIPTEGDNDPDATTHVVEGPKPLSTDERAYWEKTALGGVQSLQTLFAGVPRELQMRLHAEANGEWWKSVKATAMGVKAAA